ncbi:AEC family transporter [Megasphaera vaginalis (ex Srinivasan et al. 2021)]|uniref:Transporter, auxin efflux carrier domain protein n=1 Tax=Megasphaera vaginalis (ex Srinivasan et al. 2021) TaxID=1111454 RepID=U7UQV3_9FIRM|nr:AEC family transporter [Megasphaera vaginalis (ex Srinivasan et al. 2021)]ERT61700.1 transporter, auxin efflux carrier domain protein [Megasphaera vaginalis (ex Srinivasan et al. 2021)]
MGVLISVENIMPLLILIVIGFVLRRQDIVGDGVGSGISKLLMQVALPAAVFLAIYRYLRFDIFQGLFTGFILVALAITIWFAAAYLWCRLASVRRGRRGVLLNIFANPNVVFVGMPVCTALLGDQSVLYFLVFFIWNNISTWILGECFLLQDQMEQDRYANKRRLRVKNFLSPPLLGLICGSIWIAAGIALPPLCEKTLSLLAAMVTPLSLLYIGIILAESGLKSIRFDGDLAAAVIGRLVAAPLIMYFVLFFGESLIGSLGRMQFNTYMIMSALPVMAVLPILSNEFHGDTPFATAAVTVTTVFFLFSLTVVIAFLGL